ncbi:hypothetical protein HDV00_005687 [Rhizophlyctis rosea]|nr:hypothetical protein HDV00_005687 [Rhizophlyctis rosea]
MAELPPVYAEEHSSSRWKDTDTIQRALSEERTHWSSEKVQKFFEDSDQKTPKRPRQSQHQQPPNLKSKKPTISIHTRLPHTSDPSLPSPSSPDFTPSPTSPPAPPAPALPPQIPNKSHIHDLAKPNPNATTNTHKEREAAGTEPHERRLEEVAAQLEAKTREKNEVIKNARQTVPVLSELQFQLGKDKQEARGDDERMDEFRFGNESKAALADAKKRWERELAKKTEQLEKAQELLAALESGKMTNSSELEQLPSRARDDMEGQIEKLEESRRALMAAARLKDQELDDKLRDIAILSGESFFKSRLEEEMVAKGMEVAARQKLGAEVKETKLKLDAETAKAKDLADELEMYRTRAEEALGNLEAADLARIKAEEGESFYKIQAQELENRLAKNKQDHEGVLNNLCQKYQKVSKQLMTDLETEKGNSVGLKAANQDLAQKVEQLSNQIERETDAAVAWKKDRERMEAKIEDLTPTINGKLDGQHHPENASLNAQIRQLRVTLEDTENQKAALAEAKCSLQAKLDKISERFQDLEGRRVEMLSSYSRLLSLFREGDGEEGKEGGRGEEGKEGGKGEEEGKEGEEGREKEELDLVERKVKGMKKLIKELSVEIKLLTEENQNLRWAQQRDRKVFENAYGMVKTFRTRMGEASRKDMELLNLHGLQETDLGHGNSAYRKVLDKTLRQLRIFDNVEPALRGNYGFIYSLDYYQCHQVMMYLIAVATLACEIWEVLRRQSGPGFHL